MKEEVKLRYKDFEITTKFKVTLYILSHIKRTEINFPFSRSSLRLN